MDALAVDGCALQACGNCRVRKKKCDKIFPSCTTCKKKFIRCSYEENRTQHEIRTLRSQIERLSNGPNIPNWHLDSITQYYPIPSQWYMPFLVNYYHDLCFPRHAILNVDDGHTFSRNQWMKASFTDPCMFHGILFAASSHLEVIRGERDNSVTQYHRRQAIKLLLDHISLSRSVPDTSIATVMYLWHYESMNCHTNEASIHKKGLLQMVNANGGMKKLGFGGFLSHMITLISIGDAILNASKPIPINVEGHQFPKAPTTLLSAVLRQSEKKVHQSGLIKTLIPLLQDVHEALLNFDSDIVVERCWKTSVIPENEIMIGEFEKENLLHAACGYAATIHLNSLQNYIPFSSDENQTLLERLRTCISLLTRDNSSEVEMEIYIWLCFTGAAVAQKGKTWFLAKAGPTVMSLNHNQLTDFKRGVVQFAYVVQELQNSRNGRTCG